MLLRHSKLLNFFYCIQCLFIFFFTVLLCSYAASVGAKHFQTSAKFNHNIDEMFFSLSERMIAVKDAERQKHATKGNVVVVDSESEIQTSASKTGCCG